MQKIIDKVTRRENVPMTGSYDPRVPRDAIHMRDQDGRTREICKVLS